MDIINDFKKLLGTENVLQNEPMRNRTTFRIGGNADLFLTPQGAGDLIDAIKLAKESNLPYYIIGNGSNLLVRDKGYRGIIIQIYKNLNNIDINNDMIKVEAGALLSQVAREALNNNLTGIEALSGIPGTIGGAVCMNAGAYGCEIKDILVNTKVLHNNEVIIMDNNACEFGYRSSKIMTEDMIVIEATLKLAKGNNSDINAKMKDFLYQRNSKQPVELPSGGSTFKRPEGYFAAKLIDDCGLRGYSVGNASISKKHCGFVVNNGGATANDVIQLINNVKNIVYDKYEVSLEPEIRIIGEE